MKTDKSVKVSFFKVTFSDEARPESGWEGRKEWAVSVD